MTGLFSRFPATMSKPAWRTLGRGVFVSQNRMMFALRPQPTLNSAGQVALKVRFVALMRWFFVGFLIFAETFLATRVWAGWRPQAVARVVAVQIFFAPRLMGFALGFAIVATFLAERMVRWIARPLCRKWLSPMRGLPPESELPLYLKVGETIETPIRGRRKTEHGWEPGWLILTDRRLFWLSGIWQMTAWELDRPLLDTNPAEFLHQGTAPRWLGGYVVGMPGRLFVAMAPGVASDTTTWHEVAIADPDAVIQRFGTTEHSPNAEADEQQVGEAAIKSTRRLPLVSGLNRRRPGQSPLEVRGIALPPRRVVKPKPVPAASPNTVGLSRSVQADPLTLHGVTLPPRRQTS